MNAKLVIVTGPSGVGKGTILAEFLARYPEIFYSVSATTRAPREGETDGVNYLFRSREEFERLIAENRLIEYNEYCGNYYGTPRDPVEDALRAGRPVILEIETNGMQNVLRQYPDAVSVFIAPPSFEALRHRLEKRGSEQPEKVAARLKQAEAELALKDRFDYVLVNDDLAVACADFEKLFYSITH